METKRQQEYIESGQVLDTEKVVEMTKLDRATLNQANALRKLSKREAMAKTLQILVTNPTVSPADIASQIGRSRQTVYDYIQELEEAGRIHRNGNKR